MPDNINDVDEIGIPAKLRVKREYTLTDAALEQRKAAAKSPKKSEAMTGNNNPFKHGKYAKDMIRRLKPCLSTCEKYPCQLVDDGQTEPGKQCLDTAAVLSFYKAVHDALKNKKYEDFNELGAVTIAQQINVLHMLLEDIQRDGTMTKRYKYDKDGKETGYEIVPHPSLLTIPKMIADLQITPSEFLITPRSIAREKTDKKLGRTLADMMSGIGKGKRTEADEE